MPISEAGFSLVCVGIEQPRPAEVTLSPTPPFKNRNLQRDFLQYLGYNMLFPITKCWFNDGVGRENIFFLYPSKFLAGAAVTKDNKRKTSIHLISFTRSEVDKPESFMLDLMSPGKM